MMLSIIFIDNKGIKRREIIALSLLNRWIEAGLVTAIIFAVEYIQ